MFRQPGGPWGRVQQIVALFREKGATSPEKAMTIQELGLPPRFEQAMHRRLGATGIFVEVNGKYYLDEAKLQQIQQQRTAGGMGGARSYRGTMITLRIARMVIGLAAVVLVFSNILFIQNLSLRYVTLTLVVVWILLTVFQLYYLSKMRSRWGARMGAGQPSPL